MAAPAGEAGEAGGSLPETCAGSRSLAAVHSPSSPCRAEGVGNSQEAVWGATWAALLACSAAAAAARNLLALDVALETVGVGVRVRMEVRGHDRR